MFGFISTLKFNSYIDNIAIYFLSILIQLSMPLYGILNMIHNIYKLG